LFVIGIALIGGCDSRIMETELPGVYTANFGPARDTIELRSDGIYNHVFVEPGSSVEVRNEGSWQMNSDRGKNRITFKNFVWAPKTTGAELREAAGAGGLPVLWTTEVDRSWRGLMLVANSDLGFYYYRMR
jgi:hypothetical protein